MEPLCTIPEYRHKGLAAAALSEMYRKTKALGATLYTPEEYEESINQIKKYMGADHADVKAMEADLAKLKADNGKGEFVIYKGAFTVSTETTIMDILGKIMYKDCLIY